MLEQADIKVLEFRDELIKLLNKYNYELSGSNLDDGSMDIEDCGNNERYIMNDDCCDYVIQKEYSQYQIKDLMKEYISQLLSDSPQESCGLDIKSIGVFTNNINKANKLFNTLCEENKTNVQRFIKSKDELKLTLNDGTVYFWCQPKLGSRGKKCSGVYIDSCLTLEEINYIVLPTFIYVNKDNIKAI